MEGICLGSAQPAAGLASGVQASPLAPAVPALPHMTWILPEGHEEVPFPANLHACL